MSDLIDYIKEIKKLEDLIIIVGYPKETADKEALRLAEFAEYGIHTGTIRPFITISQPSVIKLYKKMLTKALNNPNFTCDDFIQDFIPLAIEEIKKPILDQSITPKIKSITERIKLRKGSPYPFDTLRDTGRMVNSVTSLVKK